MAKVTTWQLPHSHGEHAGLVSMLQGFAQRLRDHRDRRAAELELRRLSPQLLADVGIDSARIDEVVDSMLRKRNAGNPRRSVQRGGFTGQVCPTV